MIAVLSRGVLVDRCRLLRLAVAGILLTVLVVAWLLMVVAFEQSWSDGRISDAAFALVESPCDSACDSEAWLPTSGIVNVGFSDHILLYRLVLPPSGGETRLLLVRPSYLDSVLVLGQDSEPLAMLGDQSAQAFGSARLLHQHVALSPSVRELTLQVKSTSTLLLDVSLHTETQARFLHQLMLWTFVLYLMVIAGSLGWALVRTLSDGDGLLAAFYMKQSADFAYVAVASGFAAWFLDAGGSPIDRVSHYVFLVVSICGCLFYLRLFREISAPTWIWTALGLCLFGLAIAVLMLVQGSVRTAMVVNMIVVAVMPPVMFLAVLFARSKEAMFADVPELRWLLLAYFLVLSIPVATSALAIFGFMPATWVSMNGMHVHGGLGALLMTFMLWRRAEMQRKQLAQRDLQASLAESLLEHETQARQQHERFLDLLTHELRTPLGIVRMVINSDMKSPRLSDLAARAIRDADGILERALAASRVIGDDLATVRSRCCLAELVEDSLARCEPADRERIQVRLPHSSEMKADAALVRLAIDNLVDNALAYGSPEAPIALRFRIDRRRERIGGLCANKLRPGAGVDPGRVFERFYRGPEAHAVSGIGLGLYLVREHLQAAGGGIRARCSHGAIHFRFWWPA